MAGGAGELWCSVLPVVLAVSVENALVSRFSAFLFFANLCLENHPLIHLLVLGILATLVSHNYLGEREAGRTGQPGH
jgi:hypothetical protein